MLGDFTFSSDVLRIKAAEPRGQTVWMLCVVLSFPHRYCLLLVVVPTGDVLVFCLSHVFEEFVQRVLFCLIWLLVGYWSY